MKVKRFAVVVLALVMSLTLITTSMATSPASWTEDYEVYHFNGRTYAIFDLEVAWYEAIFLSEILGGKLAAITSQEEQDFIYDILDNGGRKFYWLGGTDENVEGEWEWVSGDEWSYDNLKGAQPGENYLGILNTTASRQGTLYHKGDWNAFDYFGTEQDMLDFGFICVWDFIHTPGEPLPDDPLDFGIALQVI
ncbi:MAG: hypothetical protein FWE85_05440 [Clostridiales bacterium]|nr:hypothetical protein [Clostridiales bacterium]